MTAYSIGIRACHQLAGLEAVASNHELISPDHFFVGLAKLEDFLSAQHLHGMGLPAQAGTLLRDEVQQLVDLWDRFSISPQEARRRMRELVGDGGYRRPDHEPVSRAPDSRRAFQRAAQIARRAGAPLAAVQHLLAALLELEDTHIHRLLADLNVDAEELRRASEDLPGGEPAAGSLLEELGVDLTDLARKGELPETVGRREEMMQVLRALGRGTKNNPVLLGEAGVGKTAIVEGLAARIASGNIHPDFRDRRILQINAADLVAGTRYRGEMEERLQGLLAAASRTDDVILFIDEIHLLVGAGAGQGAMDAASILKPALARGRIRLIGATTDVEYRRHIEKDKALERRFLPIRVEEPSAAETREILAGIRSRYEEHHRVTIQDDAIAAAVQLSVRYLPDRRLPDKACDLLDAACSWVRFGSQLSFGRDIVVAPQPSRDPVTEQTVRQVLAEQTGIPLTRLEGDEAKRVLGMSAALGGRVVGQPEAIEAVSAVMKRHYAGLSRPGQPVAVFLFVGPTGVGKTELAKATAEFLFGSDQHMIRLDMSEYMEKHTVSRLIGSPPGYVGHEQGGQLTEALARTPYAVVLLDEVEKAHPEVLDVFLQVFGEGRLTDGHGRTVDATQAIFMMTSNLISGAPNGSAPDSPSPQTAESLVRERLRPELFNRIDDIVLFRHLGEDSMDEIVRLQLVRLSDVLEERGIELTVGEEAIRWLARQGYDAELGARPLVRSLQKHLTDPIGGMILDGSLKPTHVAHVTVEGDELRIRRSGRTTL